MEEVLELIGLIYDATLEPSRWQAFLKRYAEVVNGHVAQLELLSFDSSASVSSCFGLSASDQAGFERVADLNPWLPIIANAKAGSVGASHEFISDSDYHNGDYFQEFGRRIDQFYGQAGLILKDHSGVSILGLVRSERRGPCGPRDKALLESLLPHLSRALKVHTEFARLNAQADSLLECLDRLARGVVLADQFGRIVRVNRAAERMTAQKDGLFLSSQGLRAADLNETAELQRLIFEAVQTANGQGLSSGGTMTIARPSLRRSWLVTVSPHKADSGQGLASVMLVDPEAKQVPVAEMLASTLGFTPAEVRLAQLLAAGLRIEDAADQLNIAVNTARTHLRRLLEKTELRRQTDLVLLLNQFPSSERA